MVYLVYGTQSAMIKKQIKKIVFESVGENSDDLSTMKINAKDMVAQDIAYEIALLPLGCEKRIVVVEDCFFLSKNKEKIKFDVEPNYNTLLDAIIHNDSSIDVCFSLNDSILDENNPIIQEIKKHGKIQELVDLDKNTWPTYVSKYFQKLEVEIDPKAVNELVSRVGGDLNLFINEADKLALYTKHVTYNDILLFVSRPLEDNAFLISNALLKGNNGLAIQIFKDLRVNNVEPITLISMLANQFRFINQVGYLSNKGLSNSEIARELKSQEIRITISLANYERMTKGAVERVLDELYNLDYKIKSGQVDRLYAFELFLVNFKR